MSGFASSIILSGKVFVPPEVIVEQEAAGKVGKVLGVVAAIVVPFAAPAIFGAIAGSGVLGAGLATAATAGGGFVSGLAGVLGSAAVSGIANAAVAYASGARGSQVWAAGGLGALGGAVSGIGRNFALARGATTGGVGGATGTATTAGNTWGGQAFGMGGGGLTTVQAAVPGAGGLTSSGMASGLLNRIGNIFNSGLPIDRIGTALINGIANNASKEELDALVAQQQAALAQLNAQDQAAYAQRMQLAQQMLADRDKQNPEWLARIRMADVAGIMNREFNQAKRNIAVRQGGKLDAGQRKAYERSGSLEIGRKKAEAWGNGWGEGVRNQAALGGAAAGLLTGPSYAGWEAATRLGADQVDQHNRLRRSTYGGFASVFNERDYNPSSSPETTPAQNNQGNQDNDPFGAGLRWPFG